MKHLSFVLFLLLSLHGFSQRFSFVTAVSGLRNFSPGQKFWTIGQDFKMDIHLSEKQTLYLGFTYYREGKFRNSFETRAKSSSTIPQTIRYQVTSGWNMREFSIGWKHYFVGSFDAETTWNLYGAAGFGILFTKVTNTFNLSIDTALYQEAVRPAPGSGTFNRLTLDLALGYEYPLGGNFFIYGEARTWLPASDYFSPYLHYNKKVPFPVMGNLGMRILFGD